jgi:hypothetical protein
MARRTQNDTNSNRIVVVGRKDPGSVDLAGAKRRVRRCLHFGNILKPGCDIKVVYNPDR